MINILGKVADSLSLDQEVLIRISKTAPFKYKTYSIPKRNGNGVRWIAQPSKHIKFIQREVARQLSECVDVSEAASAYVKNKNIYNNAVKHSHGNFILKLDFNDFFHSIKPWMLFDALNMESLSCEPKDFSFLENIIFYSMYRDAPLCLSIGAPSSPLVSNIVMKRFDEELLSICLGKAVVYTRYADDLTFSTTARGVLFDFPRIVEDLLERFFSGCISINSQKTVHSSKKHNRHVTGLTLTNDGRVSLGRERKRLISSMIHKYKTGVLSDEDFPRLHGLIAFSLDVEPEFIERMTVKYGDGTLNSILMR